MGILSKSTPKVEKPYLSKEELEFLSKPKSKSEKPSLSKEELEFLLKLIADSKFDGHDVQMVYSTAVKLQKIITG